MQHRSRPGCNGHRRTPRMYSYHNTFPIQLPPLTAPLLNRVLVFSQAQLASSLYHLSATHRPGVVPQNAFPALNTPTSLSMHRQAPWSSPVLEAHAYGWPSASASTSSSSSGTSFRDNDEEGDEEMMLDSPMPSGPNALFPPPSVRQSGGSGGRPCTPVLPVTTTTMTTTQNTSLVHPNSTSHPHFQYHHSGHQPHGTLDTAYDPTATSFATSDPFYIHLQQQQQQQQQQRSRTLQAIPLSFQMPGQAAACSVQYAPLLRQNHVQVPGGAPNLNPPLSSSSSSASNPYSLRPRY